MTKLYLQNVGVDAADNEPLIPILRLFFVLFRRSEHSVNTAGHRPISSPGLLRDVLRSLGHQLRG